MAAIWNRVVMDGQAFPQDEPVADDEAGEFFGSFDHCGVAVADDRTGRYAHGAYPSRARAQDEE